MPSRHSIRSPGLAVVAWSLAALVAACDTNAPLDYTGKSCAAGECPAGYYCDPGLAKCYPLGTQPPGDDAGSGQDGGPGNDGGPGADAGRDGGPGTDGGPGIDAGQDAGIPDAGPCPEPCPTPVHAPAVCRAGVCGRGACEPGWFDIDGNTTFGCEAQCFGKLCTNPVTGGVVRLGNDPIPETGFHAGSPASGGSLGAEQSNGSHRNTGTLGGPEGSPAVQQNGTHLHQGGLTGMTRP